MMQYLIKGFCIRFKEGANLMVYIVAAFSGNQTQAGALVLMALLVVSAALLGLSNAHARGLQINGRVARLQREDTLADAVKGGKHRTASKQFMNVVCNQ